MAKHPTKHTHHIYINYCKPLLVSRHITPHNLVIIEIGTDVYMSLLSLVNMVEGHRIPGFTGTCPPVLLVGSGMVR